MQYSSAKTKSRVKYRPNVGRMMVLALKCEGQTKDGKAQTLNRAFIHPRKLNYFAVSQQSLRMLKVQLDSGRMTI